MKHKEIIDKIRRITNTIQNYYFIINKLKSESLYILPGDCTADTAIVMDALKSDAILVLHKRIDNLKNELIKLAEMISNETN